MKKREYLQLSNILPMAQTHNINGHPYIRVDVVLAMLANFVEEFDLVEKKDETTSDSS